MTFRFVKSKRRTFVFLFLCILCYYVLAKIPFPLSELRRLIKCSDSQSKQRIEAMCDLYRRGMVVGKLCPALCDTMEINYDGCDNYSRGKMNLIVNCDGVCVPGQKVKAVLKSTIPPYNALISMFTTGTGEPQNVQLKTVDDLKEWIITRIQTLLSVNKSIAYNVTEEVFGADISHYLNMKRNSHAFITTLWSLVQQDEYIFSMIHEKSAIFPKIYQSCGSFYVTEFAPPGKTLSRSWNPTVPDNTEWSDRVKVALQLLDTVKILDTKFHQPLYMCDVKGPNFGINSQGQLKIIDLDEIFYESRLFDKMEQRSPCESDYGCNISWNCHGQCVNGTCQRKIRNNNLQSFCKNALGSVTNLIDLGVLRNPPSYIKNQLQEVMRRCVYPVGPDEKASDEVFEEIKTFLNSVTSIENRLQQQFKSIV